MFNMFKDIVQVHIPLLETLQQVANTPSNQESAVTSCFMNFAPYVRYYAHYTAGNADCLFVLQVLDLICSMNINSQITFQQKFSKDLAMYLRASPLPPPFSLEQYLLLPIQRYPEYISHLEQYVDLTPTADSEHRVQLIGCTD